MINKKDYIDLHMNHSYAFNKENMLNNEDWKKVIDCYNNFELSEKNVIPKKIHQIWLGGELPENYKRLTDQSNKSQTRALHPAFIQRPESKWFLGSD
jgi:mannosyltransferase OCH1-like enzyme